MYFWHLFETYCRSGKQNSRYTTCPTRFTVHVCVCMCLFWAVTQCPRDTAISISLIKYKSSVIELIYLSLFLLLLPLHSYKFSMPIRMVVCSSRKWPSKLSRKKKMKPAAAWLLCCLTAMNVNNTPNLFITDYFRLRRISSAVRYSR